MVPRRRGSGRTGRGQGHRWSAGDASRRAAPPARAGSPVTAGSKRSLR